MHVADNGPMPVAQRAIDVHDDRVLEAHNAGQHMEVMVARPVVAVDMQVAAVDRA